MVLSWLGFWRYANSIRVYQLSFSREDGDRLLNTDNKSAFYYLMKKIDVPCWSQNLGQCEISKLWRNLQYHALVYWGSTSILFSCTQVTLCLDFVHMVLDFLIVLVYIITAFTPKRWRMWNDIFNSNCFFGQNT